MEKAVLDFIERVATKNKLALSTELKEKIKKALLNMAHNKQKGGGFYIPDDEMEDLILDYENLLKEWEEKPKQEPIAKPKIEVSKSQPSTSTTFGTNELFGTKTNTDFGANELFGKPKPNIEKTKWESLELF